MRNSHWEQGRAAGRGAAAGAEAHLVLAIMSPLGERDSYSTAGSLPYSSMGGVAAAAVAKNRAAAIAAPTINLDMNTNSPSGCEA